MSDDEDVPHLSAETFAALQEFYKEQEEREQLYLPTEANNGEVSEDWQLSQFWYDDKTVESLVKIAVNTVGKNGKVALISAPTLYNKLKEELSENGQVTLFEYDRRFSIYGSDFIPYDYKSPLDIPRDMSNSFDLVIADPPFLSDECLTKTAVTIKFLTKDKVILCTGAIMAEMANRLLGLNKANFAPRHKNNLANEFYCFSNYNIDELL